MYAARSTDSRSTDSVFVGRALPSELHVVLNGMPQRFFEDSPFLLHIQVARLISEGRFLIAQRGTLLLGGVAWQDDIAFGASTPSSCLSETSFSSPQSPHV